MPSTASASLSQCGNSLSLVGSTGTSLNSSDPRTYFLASITSVSWTPLTLPLTQNAIGPNGFICFNSDHRSLLTEIPSGLPVSMPNITDLRPAPEGISVSNERWSELKQMNPLA